MKLSKSTQEILKNFSSINKNLLWKAGRELSTISEQSNILAKATLEESVSEDFGIYSLDQFLGAHSLLVDPDLDFDFPNNTVQMSSGRSKIKYRFADESVLTYPKKNINMPAADVEVTITADQLKQVSAAAAKLGHSVVSLRNDGDKVVLAVLDPKNGTANTFSVEVDLVNETDAHFDLQFLIANLRVISGDYTVKISSRLISHWENINDPIEYYIALEKSSSYSA